MSTLARIVEERYGDVPVARVQGEIDSSNAAEIGDRVRSLLTNENTSVIIDVSATTYLDSAGINLLFAIGEELRTRQQALRLVVPPRSAVARMLSITSLDRAYPTYPSQADALAAR